MPQEITDANDCIVKVGSVQGGGTAGVLIIDNFELSVTPNKDRQYGVGNENAQGRTSGNKEVDLSFTQIGQNADLAAHLDDGDFDVALEGTDYTWELDHADGAFTVTVSDGGTYEIDFDGDALGYERVSV